MKMYRSCGEPEAIACGVLAARSMVGLACDARDEAIELKLVFNGGGSAMTTETVACFVAVDVAAGGFLEVRRWIQYIADGPVQSIDGGVVAHASFVQIAVPGEDVGLSDMRVAEGVEDGLIDGLVSVGDAIRAFLGLRDDLIGVGFRAKSHTRVGLQHGAVCGKRQGVGHRGVGVRSGL